MKRKVVISARFSHGSYIGGIQTIVNQYLEHSQLFNNEKIEIELFDYQLYEWASKISNSKVREVIYIYLQKKMLAKTFSDDNNTLFHIQTSRKWTLMKDLLLAKTAKKKCHLKTIMTIHYAELKDILYTNRILKTLQLRLLRKYVDHVIFLSEMTAREFNKMGYPKEKCSVEYTFHDFSISDHISKKNNKKLKILFVGSLDNRKGIVDLLLALSKLKKEKWELTICGMLTDESIRKTYNELISEMQDKVTFRGYVSGEKKRRVFEEADVLILPSYGEGMPIVIMEAMASGCAIISTKVGAIPEVIRENNGVLITPGDISSLKNAILYYYKDQEYLRKTQENNREYAKAFSIENHIKRLCKIYNNI